MITKNLYKYACETYGEHICSITELSRRCNSTSLVECEKDLYNFDAISQTFYPSDKCPTSADCLYVDKKTIQLIEFKSGFKKIIPKENPNDKIWICEHSKAVCQKYKKLFYKNQTNETKVLIDSIRFKAIESYLTVEKHILPRCEELSSDQKKMRIKLMIVIDEDGIDSMEDILDELSDGMEKPSNCFAQIKASLKRMNKQKDTHGNDYFYDDIEVRSVQDFHNYIKNYPLAIPPK